MFPVMRRLKINLIDLEGAFETNSPERTTPPPQPPQPPVRTQLLEATLTFVRSAGRLPGVKRIALIGSLTTPERSPKDVDLLVTI
jgi:hypothetical protein